MGPIANLLGMLPGAGQMKDQLAAVDDKQLDRLQAIIRGMTPAERADPKIINASRRLRIANGSGVRVAEVNELVNRFFEARKMMAQMAGRFGFPGGGRGSKTRKGKKGKKVKGRGPTQPKLRGGLPGMPGLPGGLPGGFPGMPGGPGQLPPNLGGGLNELPPGFDPKKFKFGKDS
jgi:signal recognition particle subunit SRP54